VVLVREGTTARVYLDGGREPEITGTLPAFPSGDLTLSLGKRDDGRWTFEGKLDEVAVYPRALAASEIAAHYHTAALHRP
jgi:hypothetical protein